VTCKIILILKLFNWYNKKIKLIIIIVFKLNSRVNWGKARDNKNKLTIIIVVKFNS